jgi:hypothetical protein
MRVCNLVLAITAFAVAMGGRTQADDLYYVGANYFGTAWNFGTISASGSATAIATGLSLGNAVSERLMFAPNGTLYGFDTEIGGIGGGAHH